MAIPTVVTDLQERSSSWLWTPDLASLPAWQRPVIVALRIVYAVVRDLRDGQLSLRAMSLVYTTVIAIVPLLALSFSVLKGFGMHNKVEPVLLEGLEALGDKRFEIVARVLEFVDNVKVGVLGALGFALLIYSVVSMMHKIERSFNYTWQIKRDRTMSQRFRDYLSVIFVGPLLIFLSVGITTSVNTNTAMEYIQALPMGADFVEFVGALIPYLIMAMGFAFVYVFLPNTNVRLVAAFVGGLVTAVIWKLMGWGISTFVANSSNNLAVYSAFASIIVLMIWLYVGWLVLLVGASVSFYFQNPQYILVRRDDIQLSPEDNEALGVNILYLVYRQHHNDATPWHIDSLARHLKVAPSVVEDMVEFLIVQDYVVRAGGEEPGLHPRRPAAQVSLAGLLRRIRECVLDGRRTLILGGEPMVAELVGGVRGLLDQQYGETSFAQLVESGEE